MFCHKCGTEISPGASFCHKCGTKVATAEPEAQPTSIPAHQPPVHTQAPPNVIHIPPVEVRYDVILTHGGSKSINAIKAVKDSTGVDLREAKEMVNHAPALLMKFATYEQATKIQTALQKVGGTVSVVTSGSDTNTNYYQNSNPQPTGSSTQTQVPTPPAETVPPAEESSKFKLWWGARPKAEKVLITIGAVIAGIIAICLLIAFLREFGALLLGILIVASLVFGLFVGTREEKLEARRTLIKLIGGFIGICVISLVVALKWDAVTDVIQPGLEVRGAYLSQYSEKVTVEEAFDNFFTNEKWSTYESEGYKYVAFTGTCYYDEEKIDVRIVFKITGEQFQLAQVDIDGQKQVDLIALGLMAKIYEDY